MVSRTVILIGTYAIKIPNGIIGNKYKWLNAICQGWFNNRWELEEYSYYTRPEYNMPLCPLVASLLGGFILIFRRCEELSLEEFNTIKWWTFSDTFLHLTEIRNDDFNYPGSRKRFSYDYHHIHNVGKYKGQIVAIDLGYPGRLFTF